MSGADEVRTARWRLAKVLSLDSGGLSEAREQLSRALSEQGNEPPDWQIYSELGRLDRAASESAAALHNYLHAVATAPLTAVGDPAKEALALLDDVRPDAAGAVLDGVDLNALTRRAAAENAPGALVRLTTGALMLRGDPEAALDLLRAKPTAGLPVADDQKTLEMVAHIRVLVEDDQWDEAMEVLERTGLSDQPAFSSLTGLVYYACGRPEKAWAAVEAGHDRSSFLGAVLRALILLQRASRAGPGEERRSLLEQAFTAATDAAQNQPTRPDGSLLRAEVMLEGGLDLDEGRHLLHAAMRRLKGDPTPVDWWRAQKRVRDDEVYAYVRIEVAAAQGRHDDVIALADAGLIGSTEPVHRGAAAELEARARAERGDTGGAASAYIRAANSFSAAELRARAITALQEAVRLGTPAGTSLDLVELLYAASFPVDQGGDGDGSAVAEGLRHLDLVDDVVTGGDAVRACFLAGMMLFGEAVKDDSQRLTSWRPLPYLLLATLAEDGYYFRQAQLSWALHGVHLWGPARYFSEVALDRSPVPNDWLVETAIAMRLNWTGLLDERLRRLLPSTSNRNWADAVEAYGYLLADDRKQLCRILDRVTLGQLWARLVRAHGTVRCGPFVESMPQFLALQADAISRGDSEVAVEAALALGNVDTAREQLKDNSRTGVLSLYLFAVWQAITDVVQGVPGSPQRIRELIHRAVRPFDLRALANVYLPTLIASAAYEPEVTDVLAALRRDVVGAAEGLPKDPPLTAELDTGHAWCDDTDLVAAVRALLDAAQHLRTGERTAAAAGLRQLAYRPERCRKSFEQALRMALGRAEDPTERG